MAAPNIASQTQNTETSASSITLTAPTGITVGDLLLILLGSNKAVDTDEWDSDEITGWTRRFDYGTSGAQSHIGAFWKIAVSSDIGNDVTVTKNTTSAYWGAFLRITGADDTTPIDVDGGHGVTTPADTTHTVSEVTTTGADRLAIYLLSGAVDGSPWSVSGTGWTEVYENALGTYGEKDVASAGGSGDATVTASASGKASHTQIAISPASGTIDELDADISASGTTTALFSAIRALAVTVSGASTVAGSPIFTKAFTASISATSSVAGSLGRERPLTASVAGQSTAAGVLARERPLVASVSSASATTAAMTRLRSLVATIAASSSVTSDPEFTKSLVASISGASSVVAVGERPAVTYEASISASSTVSASPVGVRGLVADIQSVTAVEALTGVVRPLTATLSSTSTVTVTDFEAFSGKGTGPFSQLSVLAIAGPIRSFDPKVTAPEDLTASVTGTSSVSVNLDAVLPTALLIPKHRQLIPVYEV